MKMESISGVQTFFLCILSDLVMIRRLQTSEDLTQKNSNY